MSFNAIKPIALSLTSPLWIYRKEAPNNSFLDASLLLRCFLDACHSFDHAVEVNSRLSTITNTSQIYLGGGAEKHLIATCLGTVGLYYTYRTYNDNRSEAPAEIEEKHVDIKPTANRTPAQDLDMLN